MSIGHDINFMEPMTVQFETTRAFGLTRGDAYQPVWIPKSMLWSKLQQGQTVRTIRVKSAAIAKQTLTYLHEAKS